MRTEVLCEAGRTPGGVRSSLADSDMYMACVCVCSVMFDSLQLHGLQPARLFHLWNFPGKDTGVGYHFLLQGIFLSQGSNLHWQADSLPLTTGEALLCKCIHLYKIQYIYYVNKFIHLIYIKCLLLRAALLCCARELLQ